jgi:hypothetical protein
MAWHDLHAYWRDHHVDGRPPSRADIDPPVDMPWIAPNLMLYDVPPTGFRLRLIGSELVRRAGKDLTGQVLDPARPSIMHIGPFLACLEKIVATRAPVLFSVARSPESPYGAIVLLLPLEKRGNVEMILGGCFYEPLPAHYVTNGWRPGAFAELVLEDELSRERGVRYCR